MGGVNPCLADLKGDMYLIVGGGSVLQSGRRECVRQQTRFSLVFLRPGNATVGRHVKQGLSNRVRAHRALTNSAGSCLAGAGLRAGLLRLMIADERLKSKKGYF